MVISPRVTSPHATDFSSLKALFASPRLAGKTGQDLAIAIWELFVDKQEGLYHSCPPVERLTDHFVWDPLKIFNCFGWSICGLTADLMAVLYKAAGFADARIANLKEHEAAEVFYDGGWHLLDGDLQAFHRRHPPHQAAIASHAECLADPTLVSRQQNPSTPYYLPDRPPDKMAELYKVPPTTDRRSRSTIWPQEITRTQHPRAWPLILVTLPKFPGSHPHPTLSLRGRGVRPPLPAREGIGEGRGQALTGGARTGGHTHYPLNS